MSTLNRSTFDTTYVNASGTFADNTTRLITEGDMRQFADDIDDSLLNRTDDLSAGAPSDWGSSTKASSTFMTCYSTYVDIPSASVLTANSSPVTIVASPGADYVIVPIMFYVAVDFNSVSYATNTTFNFLINGVFVTADSSTILDTGLNLWATILPIAYNTITDLRGQPLVFKVQTGNPTAGNSPLNVGCVYKIYRFGEPA